jgi:ABC-2 type transport system permease protein
MSKLAAVWRREFRGYWYSPVAYIVITVFLVVLTWMFFLPFFIQGQADTRGLFGPLPWFFLFLAPAITMRQWAEEKKSGTIELLMTMPVREWDVVLGKFLSSLSLFAVILALTLPLILTVAGVSQNGLDWGQVLTSYLGALLLGAAYLAIGGWVSSFTQNQIVAFILGMAVIFLFLVVGLILPQLNPGFLTPVLTYLGIGNHYQSIARGVIDSRDLLYYGSMIFLFLYLTVRSVESRKWS